MNLYALSGLFTVITGLTISPLIFIHSRKEDRLVNGLWLILNIAISLYGLGIYIAARSPDYGVGLLGWKVAYLGVTMIPVLLFHHTYKFTGTDVKKSLLFILYGLGFLFLMLSLVATPYFWKLRFVFGFWYPTSFPVELNNISYMFFVIYFFILGLLSIHKVWHVRAGAQGERKTHLNIFLSALIVGWVGGSYSFLPTFSVDAFPYFNMSIPIYQGIIGYAIIRYGLFYTKTITTEVVAAFMAAIFLATILSPQSALLRLILFVGFALTLVILVRSALSEERVRGELKDLNIHLEQRVQEQTGEVRRAYEVEKKARLELEELNKAKDQFVLATQHHLRTPLTIVRGYLDVLRKDLSSGKVTTLAVESVEKADIAADRLAKLMNELLNISEMEVGKSILNKRFTDTREIIDGIIDEFRDEIKKNDIKVLVSLPPRAEDRTLNIDPEKIREAIWNLVDNAAKYNKKGGSLKITGEISDHPIEKGKRVFRLTVADTGMGINGNELPKLFTMYFEKGKAAEELNVAGKGIGLMVVKNIVSAHGGKVWAESEGEGKGTQFIVELPI